MGNFIYANRKSHPNRDAMFHKLSAFRFVNSLGPHLNNTPGDGHRANGAKIEYLFASQALNDDGTAVISVRADIKAYKDYE